MYFYAVDATSLNSTVIQKNTWTIYYRNDLKDGSGRGHISAPFPIFLSVKQLSQS